MYSFKLCPLVLLAILICINQINSLDPYVPCGLRFNDRSIGYDALLNLQSMIREKKLVKSRALDTHAENTNLTIKKTEEIKKQKQKLSKLLSRLGELSDSFDPKTKNSFNRLLIESRSLLDENGNSTMIKDEKSAKKLTIRSVQESEVSNLFNQSRSLMKKIEKNMIIKTRIIGGVKGNSKEFPWLVSIQIKDSSHICGGAIISKDFVLTAAHCMIDPSNKLYEREYVVAAGSSFWRKGKIHRVVKKVAHPEFNAKEFKNDVAVFQVKPPFALKKGRIIPICLPPKGLQIRGAATIAGWGTTSKSGIGVASEYIMKANIEILEDKVCEKNYPNFDAKQMICAGQLSGERDSCQGDSGGPLQARMPNGRVYLAGAVSFGDDCGKAYFPGVYAKQSWFVDWVQKTCQKLAKES